MKRYSKFFAIILAIILVLPTTPAAFAAGVEPGKTASVSFSFTHTAVFDSERSVAVFHRLYGELTARMIIFVFGVLFNADRVVETRRVPLLGNHQRIFVLARIGNK